MDSLIVFFLTAFDFVADLVTLGAWSRHQGNKTVADHYIE